jgi:hypothetical protein
MGMSRLAMLAATLGLVAGQLSAQPQGPAGAAASDG